MKTTKMLEPIPPGEILMEEFMRPLGISINALATAGFDIPNDCFLRWIDSHGTSREEAGTWFPAGRLGRPEEIEAAVLYLASDEARFAIGTVLTLDGGFTAH